ncbi:DUF4431 domain-containing protein [Rugamonas sp. A1-17]|nr:DUF4431 domain-containing protein [Rugamonas sp. A1-17]
MRRLSVIFLLVCGSVRAETCQKYDVANVELTGRVRVETFFGPPNFGESPETDSKERQAVLHLDRPICTVASADSPAEERQIDVTLVPMGDFTLASFDGKPVTVKGKLFYAITGHHHTNVLISIDTAPQITGK